MEVAHLFEHAENIETYHSGAVIFQEGQAADKMFVILEGEVGIQVHGQPINKMGRGEFLGEMALVDSAPRSATAIAVTPCRLAPVDEKHFLFMVTQTPYFALQVMRSLTNKLRSLTSRTAGA